MKHKYLSFSLLLSFCLILPRIALCDTPQFKIIIKDHLFIPSRITIPPHTKVKLIIENLDNTPEEFESYELNREKIIMGNKKVNIFIGPLPPGKYPFFGEFHPNTAQGIVIVKESEDQANVE